MLKYIYLMNKSPFIKKNNNSWFIYSGELGLWNRQCHYNFNYSMLASLNNLSSCGTKVVTPRGYMSG